MNSQEPCGSRNLHFGEVSLFSLIAASSYRASIGADRLYAERDTKSRFRLVNLGTLIPLFGQKKAAARLSQAAAHLKCCHLVLTEP